METARHQLSGLDDNAEQESRLLKSVSNEVHYRLPYTLSCKVHHIEEKKTRNAHNHLRSPDIKYTQ